MFLMVLMVVLLFWYDFFSDFWLFLFDVLAFSEGPSGDLFLASKSLANPSSEGNSENLRSSVRKETSDLVGFPWDSERPAVFLRSLTEEPTLFS